MSDLTPIWFLVAMILVGGAIAAVGDWIGRKIGKSRRRFGRLRPRHTAILFTFFAGAAGVLISILAISAASKEAREWILQGNALRAQVAALETRLATERKNLEAAEKRSENALADAQEQEKKLQNANKELKNAQADTRRLTDQARSLRADADRLKREVTTFRSRLSQASVDQKRLQAQVSELNKTSTQLSANNRYLSEQSAKIIQQNGELTNTRRELEADADRLKAEVNSLRTAATDAQEDRRLAEEQRRIVADELQRALRSLTDIEDQLAFASRTLQNQRAIIQDLQLASRLNELMFRRNDELARKAVDGPFTATNARTFILALTVDAADRAREEGAEPPNDAAGFASIQLDEGFVTSEQQLNEAIAKLNGRSGPTLLIARALLNAFERERVPLSIEVLPNPVVYEAGEMVGELRIEPGLSNSEILRRIEQYLQTTLRNEAIRDGIIPVIGPDAGLGSLSPDATLEAVNIIREANRTARVQFLTTRLTRAGDSLDLTLRIR